MARAKRISVFFRKVLLSDSKASIHYTFPSARITFLNIFAKDEIYHEYRDFVISSGVVDVGTRRGYCVTFNCSDMSEEPEKEITGYTFDRAAKKRDRRAVTAQEEEGARIIGGKRHVGSGAIEGLKSDASSDYWQQEAKQTRAQSIGLKLEWLDKITREARTQGKHPMLFIRFTESASHIIADDDWVVIPAKDFESMEQSRCS